MAQLPAAISEVRGGFISVVAVWHSLWVNPPLHHVKPLVRVIRSVIRRVRSQGRERTLPPAFCPRPI
jgi:hypothetical protein